MLGQIIKFIWTDLQKQGDITETSESDAQDDVEWIELASKEPREALQCLTIAQLYAHYIQHLSPWYDLNDADLYFGVVVPERALINPLLFKALIAFAARHKSKSEGSNQGLAHIFHVKCVQDLLSSLTDLKREFHGELLAATCLLRSYEILDGKVTIGYLTKIWS